MGSPLFDEGVHSLGRAGGDGLLRLWGTKAAGSYGEIARITNRKSPTNGNKSTLQKNIQTPIVQSMSLVHAAQLLLPRVTIQTFIFRMLKDLLFCVPKPMCCIHLCDRSESISIYNNNYLYFHYK